MAISLLRYPSTGIAYSDGKYEGFGRGHLTVVILTVSGAFILTAFLFVQFRVPRHGVICSAAQSAAYDRQEMHRNYRGLSEDSVVGDHLDIHEAGRSLLHKKAPKREYTLKSGPNRGKVLSLKENTRCRSSKHSKAEIIARRAKRIKRLKRPRRLKRLPRMERIIHRRDRARRIRSKGKPFSGLLAKKRLEKLREEGVA